MKHNYTCTAERKRLPGEVLSLCMGCVCYRRMSACVFITCMRAHVNRRASCFGILMSVVRGPPIVSCDPLSRLLPKELYLPLVMITAHKEELDRNMCYSSARFSLYRGHRKKPLKVSEMYGSGCHIEI